MSSTRNVVSNGPCKYDLMRALFDGKTVEFELKPEGESKGKVKIQVASVFREDGSDNSWILSGRFRDGSATFRGGYRTDTRKGGFEVTPAK